MTRRQCLGLIKNKSQKAEQTAREESEADFQEQTVMLVIDEEDETHWWLLNQMSFLPFLCLKAISIKAQHAWLYLGWVCYFFVHGVFMYLVWSHKVRERRTSRDRDRDRRKRSRSRDRQGKRRRSKSPNKRNSERWVADFYKCIKSGELLLKVPKVS